MFRNLFETGTSSAVSLYADNYPYTEFEVHENIMHAPTDYTVNFPNRGTGWSPLENGFRRELVGNYFMRGSAGYVDDTTYFSKTFANKLFDGTPVPDLMDEGTSPVFQEPVLLKSCWNNFGGGFQEFLDTWSFTPSPNSTLFLIAGVMQAAHTTVQAPTVTVTGQYPQTFSAVMNTPLQNAAGADPSHGMRLWLYKAETGGTTSFEHIRFDPYTGTQLGWICFWVYEVTGVTGMSLVHSVGSMVTSGRHDHHGRPLRWSHQRQLVYGLRRLCREQPWCDVEPNWVEPDRHRRHQLCRRHPLHRWRSLLA